MSFPLIVELCYLCFVGVIRSVIALVLFLGLGKQFERVSVGAVLALR